MNKFLYSLLVTLIVSKAIMGQEASKIDTITTIFKKTTPPFSYNLNPRIFPSKNPEAEILLCCHGYGANNLIGQSLFVSGKIHDHIISFNFPDHDLHARSYDPHTSSFGSIDELLPLLYMLKQCVIEGGLEKINLYGFSAGGAAVINALALLHTQEHTQKLKEIGISSADMQRIVNALQKGIVILDCPLKSVQEIIDTRGSSQELEILHKRYTKNGMIPLEVVPKLEEINLHIILYFQNPDDILGNRDDNIFIERLQKVNRGKTELVIGTQGTHNQIHEKLWERYRKHKTF